VGAQEVRHYDLSKDPKLRKKKRKSLLYKVSMKPTHDNLPWPGLKARDHLSRVVTRAVKAAKEAREADLWAEKQIARVLANVSPRDAMRLVFREMSRRGRPIPRFAKALLELFPG
jgi:hypothetical protein